MRRNRYNITPTTCPHCGFVHHAADIVRINDVQLRYKQCGKAFTPPSTERNSQRPPNLSLSQPNHNSRQDLPEPPVLSRECQLSASRWTGGREPRAAHCDSKASPH